MVDYTVKVEIEVKNSDLQRVVELIGKLIREANIMWRPWHIMIRGEEDD